MANPTTNFGWVMPTATDLVTDLPADFDVFGQAVDTDFVGLKGGTTGQVLAKASATDLDFVWSADAAGMTNPMTTTGDIIYSSPGSTPLRLGIGSTDDVLKVAGGVPTWAAPAAGGGMTQIATGSLSSTLVLISSIPATYKNLVLVIRQHSNGTSNSDIRVRFNNDSTAGRHGGNSSGGTYYTNTTFGGTYANIGDDSNNSATTGLISATFYDYTNTTTWKMMVSDTLSAASTATNFNYSRRLGFYNQTTAISSLGLIPQSGSFNTGTYILYGVS